MLIFSRFLLAINLFFAIVAVILIAYDLAMGSVNQITIGFGFGTLLFNMLIAYLSWTNWNDIDRCLKVL